MDLEKYETEKGGVIIRLLRERMALAGLKVLEVGPSTGALMRLLEAEGCELHAIDVASPWSDEYRYDQAKRTLINLEDADPPTWMNGRFDLIIAQEVIEHIRRPYDFINRLKMVMKDSAVLFVTTPNLVGVTMWLKGERWCGVTTPTHYILYSPLSLTFMMENLGLKPLRVFANLIPIATANRHIALFRINKLLGGLKIGGGLMGFYAKALPQ